MRIGSLGRRADRPGAGRPASSSSRRKSSRSEGSGTRRTPRHQAGRAIPLSPSSSAGVSTAVALIGALRPGPGPVIARRGARSSRRLPGRRGRSPRAGPDPLQSIAGIVRTRPGDEAGRSRWRRGLLTRRCSVDRRSGRSWRRARRCSAGTSRPTCPAAGAGHRGEQLALLAGLRPRAGDRPAGRRAARRGRGLRPGRPTPTSPAAVNVREWRRDYDRPTGCPGRWSRSWPATTSLAQQEWVVARAGRRLRPVPPLPGDDRRPEAAARPSAWRRRRPATTPCSTSTSRGPRGRPRAAVRRAPPRARAAGRARSPARPPARAGDPPPRLSASIGSASSARRWPPPIGFDFQRGRLDTTAHPFCSGIGPGDCRITTRYDAARLRRRLLRRSCTRSATASTSRVSTPTHYGTPLGEAVSLGIHESQSRLWENLVGRGRPFWAHFFPLARAASSTSALGDVDARRLPLRVNHVEPSLIRVEADEVTYNLHILVRFELEQALLSGDLAVGRPSRGLDRGDTANLWASPRPTTPRAASRTSTGAAGLIGYFPTYTLGNLYAAQLFAARRPRPRRPGRAARARRLRRPARRGSASRCIGRAAATARPT